MSNLPKRAVKAKKPELSQIKIGKRKKEPHQVIYEHQFFNSRNTFLLDLYAFDAERATWYLKHIKEDHAYLQSRDPLYSEFLKKVSLKLTKEELRSLKETVYGIEDEDIKKEVYKFTRQSIIYFRVWMQYTCRMRDINDCDF